MDNLTHLKNIANDFKILYVEDDKLEQEQTLMILNEIFDVVDCVSNGEEAYRKYLKANQDFQRCDYYDIVITDIRMPLKNGIELSKDIIRCNRNQAILVMSAHDESASLIELINIGVKYFLPKPIMLDKIIDSLLNVANKIVEYKNLLNKVIFTDGYKWCKKEKILEKDGKEVNLSSSEITLLDLLISNPYLTFSYNEIYEHLNEDKYEKELSIDSIKSIIKRIRKKIPHNLIKNIYGSGYKINTELFL